MTRAGSRSTGPSACVLESTTPAPPAGQPDTAWVQAASPRPCDIANQLIQGYVLSFIVVDDMDQEAHQSGPAAADHLPGDPIQGQSSLAARMLRLKPQFDALRAHAPPSGDLHCFVEQIPSRPNA